MFGLIWIQTDTQMVSCKIFGEKEIPEKIMANDKNHVKLTDKQRVNRKCIVFTYSKTCVKYPLSRRQKIGFQDRLLLNEGQKYCSCDLSSRPLFCLFLSARFTQVLLYINRY